MSAAVGWALWPRRWRPVEMVAQQRAIGRLRTANDRAAAVNAELAAQLRIARDELAGARNEVVELRRHRRALLAAVAKRSSLELPADLLALIEEEGLAE